MNPSTPQWLPTFCCVIPFLALIGFAIGNTFGTAVESAGLIGLVLLCAQVNSWVLKKDPIRTFRPFLPLRFRELE